METTLTASAHTPGPWVLCDNGEIKAQRDIGRWDDYVCRMPFSSLPEAREMGPSQIPNARLIVAAPRLLEACWLALDEIGQWVEVMGGAEDPRTRQALAALNEAIAKATIKAA
jgi:hypothetical protein